MNKTISRMLSIVMALALTLGMFTPAQAEVAAAPAAVTFVTEADSRVHEVKPTTNYGTYGTILYVEGGADPDIESYFRFTVGGIAGTVTDARLRVYVVDGTSNGPEVYATSNSWEEKGITWENRPARTGQALDDKGTLQTNTWAEYNVTAAVTGNGTYSFILATDSTDSLSLSAREGSYPAQLIVTGSDSTTGSSPVPPAAQPTQAPPTAQPTNTVTLPTATPVAPTVTPTTAPVTPVPVQPTATPTSVPPTSAPAQPTATATTVPPTSAPVQPTATLQPTIPPPQTSGSGIWISSTELMRLPTSGQAWDKLRATAYGSWGTADLKNQDNKHAINTLAGALVYARTGDAALRAKVRDGILAAKRSMDESGEWQERSSVLASGRQIGAYVIAADLIGLRSFDAAADNEFRSWLTIIRTTNIGTHGRWKAITYTCENAAANWSTFACASRIAASIYIGDTADVSRAATIIRAFFGERNLYPANAPGQNGYFQHTADYNSTWACNEPTWTAINPGCVKSGVNIDGALVEDASRGGGCCTLQGAGTSYSWEALQGLFVSAELLYRTGAHGNPYQWSNQALKRSMDFLQRSGWGITGPATYVPWMANARYGTSYPASLTTGGRIMSWGDWLYQR